jgi:Zn-dependent peptidase ImmA (M78 family)
MQLRGLLGLGTAPVGDILRVAELQLGFRVFVRPLDSKVAGVYAYHAELGACVLVNSTHPRQRRAWTLAHEIGHFMSNRDAAEVVSTKAEENDDPFADAFAGAFLLPPPSLRRRFGEIGASGGKFSPRDLVLLAHEHQVSVEALCRWLERLRLLPRQTYEALRARGFNAEHVRGVLGDQPEEANVPVPPRLLMIAAEAHQRGIVTEGQLVDMLGIDRLAVRELLDGIPGGTFDDAT